MFLFLTFPNFIVLLNQTTLFMTTQQIANRLVELCRTGKNDQCYTELFAPTASSHEMPGVPWGDTHGIGAMLAKSAAWAADVKQVHKMEVTEPVVYGDFFALGMGIDLEKKDGTRSFEQEMCVYTVAQGKIISERFIYKMPG